jgi:ribosomal protein S18 acetylase RimI-like enzyme
MRAPGVCKYPADVAPFAAFASNDEESLRQLHALTSTGEGISLIGDRPPGVEGFIHVESLAGLQMVYPIAKPPTDRYVNPRVMVQLITELDAPAMVALTDLAFPGYFRKRTCEMGTYYGVFDSEQLIAMTGERLAFDHCREISGVVTHPAHTGKGLAATLIFKLMQDHLQNGLQSFLHVSAGNIRAIALYERLGFSVQREVTFHRVRRVD